VTLTDKWGIAHPSFVQPIRKSEEKLQTLLLGSIVAVIIIIIIIIIIVIVIDS
jgi:hypothetical protein